MTGSTLARKTMVPTRGFTIWLESGIQFYQLALETNYWITTSGTWHLRAKVCAQSLTEKAADIAAHRSSVFDVTALAVAIRYDSLTCIGVVVTNSGKCISCKELLIRQCKKCRNEYCREDDDGSSETMVCY
jgi:hypothetical protein